MGLLNTLRFILDHPLNRGRRFAALRQFAAWQVSSRLSSGPIPREFVDGMRLLVTRGQTGATGNIYAGLHELPEMAFVLHVLRPGDLFVDVGANVGSYTILAAAAGADCVSLEPGPALEALNANVRFNDLTTRVETIEAAAGPGEGTVNFVADQDTTNHVALATEQSSSRSVRMTSLDCVLENRNPVVIKVDVEGFESEVLSGASQTLAKPSLLAMIIETNGSGSRYGSSDDTVHRTLTERGFVAAEYDAFARLLEQRSSPVEGANTIYARDIATVASRVSKARHFALAGGRRI